MRTGLVVPSCGFRRKFPERNKCLGPIRNFRRRLRYSYGNARLKISGRNRHCGAVRSFRKVTGLLREWLRETPRPDSITDAMVCLQTKA